MQIIFSMHEWKVLDEYNEFVIEIQQKLAAIYQPGTIYSRFDTICDLITLSEQILFSMQPEDSVFAEQIAAFRKNAITVAQAIVDTQEEVDLKRKIVLRKKFRQTHPHYMPWNIPITKSTIFPSKQQYFKHYALFNTQTDFDVKYTVKNLSLIEREDYRLLIVNGKLQKMSIDYAHDILTIQLINYHDVNFTETAIIAKKIVKNALPYPTLPNPTAGSFKKIFVITQGGDIFTGNPVKYCFHHSSFCAEENLFGAGEWIIEDGIIRQLGFFSGHYQPQAVSMLQISRFLKACHLLTPQGEFYAGNTKELEMPPLCKYMSHFLKNPFIKENKDIITLQVEGLMTSEEFKAGALKYSDMFMYEISQFILKNAKAKKIMKEKSISLQQWCQWIVKWGMDFVANTAAMDRNQLNEKIAMEFDHLLVMFHIYLGADPDIKRQCELHDFITNTSIDDKVLSEFIIKNAINVNILCNVDIYDRDINVQKTSLEMLMNSIPLVPRKIKHFRASRIILLIRFGADPTQLDVNGQSLKEIFAAIGVSPDVMATLEQLTCAYENKANAAACIPVRLN